MMLCKCRKGLRVLMLKTAVIAAAVLLSGCIQESSPPAGQAGKSQLPGGMPTDKTQPESSLLTEGATLFAKLCTSCHGTAGNGRGVREAHHCSVLNSPMDAPRKQSPRASVTAVPAGCHPLPMFLPLGNLKP